MLCRLLDCGPPHLIEMLFHDVFCTDSTWPRFNLHFMAVCAMSGPLLSTRDTARFPCHTEMAGLGRTLLLCSAIDHCADLAACLCEGGVRIFPGRKSTSSVSPQSMLWHSCSLKRVLWHK